MRKSRLFLLVLPILLCGAILWARDAAWKRMEADFRQAVLLDPAFSSSSPIFDDDDSRGIGVSTINKRGSAMEFKRIGNFNLIQMKEILADIHLRKSTRDGGEDATRYLEIAGTCGAMRMTSSPTQTEIESEINSDLGISKYGKSAVILSYISSCQSDWGEQWSAYELTPESALALRERISEYFPEGIKIFTKS